MNADTVRQKPRIKKENGVWVCCYLRPWRKWPWDANAHRYLHKVEDALQLCDRLNAKNHA